MGSILYNDDDTDAPSTTVLEASSGSRDRVTERLGQTVMGLVSENVSLTERLAVAEAAASSSREDRMVHLGGKRFAHPQNAQEVMERARRDVKNMKDKRRRMKKTAASKSAAACFRNVVFA